MAGGQAASAGGWLLLLRADARGNGEVQLVEAVSLLSREHGAGSEQRRQCIRRARGAEGAGLARPDVIGDNSAVDKAFCA